MDAQTLSKEILSEIELETVIAFAQNKVAFEAVKKYVLAVAIAHGRFEKDKPFKGNVNFALNLAWPATQGRVIRSDEELGQSLRALTYAVQLVESGFSEIEDMKEIKKVEHITSESTSNPTE
jgi:hypothetical protein